MKPLATALAAVFFLVAILYAVGVLQIGTHEAGPHVKHAILFVVLGILSLVWLRFQSNSATSGLR